MIGRWARRQAALPAHDRIELPDTTLEYRIQSSVRRRTVALRLEPDGALIVAAPARLNLPAIRDFVISRRDWITAKRAVLARHPPLLRLDDGAEFPLLDSVLRLQLTKTPGAARCVRIGGALDVCARDVVSARAAVERWYRRIAVEHFSQRIAELAPLVGRAPNRITVRAPRTRWGSCSSRGNISLHWRLMLLPRAVADYVLVHELCHLLVPNHSPGFWRQVARILPDWPEHRRQLVHHGRRPLWESGDPFTSSPY